jgi:uncharacterized repeat protein (TIGR01451 family)
MNFWLFRWSTPPAARAPRTLRRRSARPELEALEDRSLPSATPISGFVYHDANNDGLYQPGAEQPYGNIQLQLRNAAGATVATAVTDANGYYAFTTDSTIDTSPHTQTFTATFPSTMTNYNLTGQLPQFDPSLGTLQSLTITNAGAITSDIRVENTSNTSGTTITGTVGGNLSLAGPGVNLVTSPERNTGSFDASAFDGTLDFAGSSGTDFGPRTASASRSVQLSGAALAPFLGTGQVAIRESAVATSTASGGGNVLVGVTSSATATVTVTYNYIPNNTLRPGNYTIVEVTQPPGTIEGKVSSNGVVLSNPPGQDVIPITVTGPDLPNNDFGKLVPSSLMGFVFLDNGAGAYYNDGIPEPGEGGIGNVTLTLTGANDQGAVNVATVTDSSGYYHFDNLRPGTYAITETPPAGYIDGKDMIGSQGGVAGHDVLYGIALGQGVQGVYNDFAELTPVVSPATSTADLKIVKTAGAASVPVGSALTYTLTVSNLGPDAAAGVTVRDTLPPGVTFVSAAGAGWQSSAGGGVVTFTTGSLAAGASSVLTVTILAPTTPGNITNVSTVTSNTPDTNPSNNTSQVTVAVTAAPPPAGPSQQVYAPLPASFPAPGDITVISKTSLFSDSGIDSNDPTLMAQISFIDGLYRTLLGRPSDTGGLIYWVRQLRAGLSRDAIVQAFWTSEAHRDQEIETLYRTYLNRDAGAGDFAYWNGVFAGGASETDVAIQILTSQEYTARVPDNASFVDTLFRSALGRPAGAAGVQFWDNVINTSGRAAAARYILLSDEATNRLLTFVYAQDLHRGINDGERSYWIGQVHAGLNPQDICRMVLASDEFYALATQASHG